VQTNSTTEIKNKREITMKTITKIMMTGLVLSLMACPKNKDKEAQVEPVQAPEAVADTTKQSGEPQAPVLTAEQIEQQRLEARAKEIEAMIDKIMSDDVYFDYDKAELTDKAKEMLSEVAEILMKETMFDLRVEGHTDERGTESYNMSLGGKRSQAVQKYLVAYGIQPARIETLSFGEEMPKAEGSDEEAYAKNRRASFKVIVKK
jgi:peptidoglycan-associated lipoprotein